MSVSVSYSFSPTTIIESSQVNQNFTDLVNYINNTACVSDMVMGWKGAVVDIPTGWTLDDDLKDRFIVGAGNSYAVGDTGGSNTHTLTEAEMPEHNHGVSDPGHKHNIWSENIQREQGNYNNDVLPGSSEHYEDTEHADTGISINNTGSGDAHESRPPYYALCWIKKS